MLCAIEIGRRLKEAKALVSYGEWSQWLEKSVNYSQRTVNNLLRLFEEDEGKEDGLPNSQTLANFSYIPALILPDIPIDNISVNELQKAVKERDQIRQENNNLRQKLAANRQELEETFQYKPLYRQPYIKCCSALFGLNPYVRLMTPDDLLNDSQTQAIIAGRTRFKRIEGRLGDVFLNRRAII